MAIAQEVDFYLNPQGLSYKVRSQYEWGSSISIPFAVEYVFLGEQILEYTIGVRSNWSSTLSTYSECRLGQQLEFSQTVSMAFMDNWVFGAGWIRYSGRICMVLVIHPRLNDRIGRQMNFLFLRRIYF